MKKVVAILLILLMLFSLFQGASRGNVVKAESQPIWSMFHYNAQHTGQCPYNTSNNNGTLKWKYQTGSNISSSPAIASDGTIYVGSGNGYLYAIGRQCIITSSAELDGSISPTGAVTVNYGADQTFTVTPNTGYHIKDVKVDGVSVGAVSSYTLTNVMGDHTYTIKATAGSGGSISPSGTITVNNGDSKTFTIIPDSGYKISAVKVDGVSKGSVSSYTFQNITANHTIEAVFERTTTVIILQIGNPNINVNGVTKPIDEQGTKPVIKNNRTLVPIRAIVEALGGTITWDGTERKVTITLKNTTIELWIGKNTAKVNEINTPIDSTNSKVVPEIINSRTMLPLRFVSENLGVKVDWDGKTKTITVKDEEVGSNILVHVYVLKDSPDEEFELIEGEPKNVGIYEFYLKKPGIPGSGAFRKLDSISLDKLNETEFYGEKFVKRIDGVLCLGYPSTNFIDGKACVEIDQGQNEVDVTVHYWKTRLGIL